MLSFILLCFSYVSTAIAEEPVYSIVVEAHKDFEVYVAPTQIINNTDDIEDVIGGYSPYGHASTHSRSAQVSNGRGGYEPITLNSKGFKVYNEDTIQYAWDNCNYKRDPKLCASTNDHFLLETHITINNSQLVVAMYLFDPDMQIISQGIVTNTKIIKWIKQQSTTTNVNQQGTLPQQQTTQGKNCSGSSCDGSQQLTQTPGYYQNNVIVDKPLEELPLKWEIPHRLLESQIMQASMRVWVGVKID